ncbi:Ig-like domain-containing protein [Echinimonas agarilytica]|uniref:Ig-like domain-containing protein n=1 Tax=Echinimonas agarilytica TaxID=1215918 RepID=A0AA41W953_9GAMM|nr:Ig-like domain-containing protein [Echinimonas agarilytica]MCM2681379.1 Ig-like domain-containing protein [Echinimonas agarilytica]
MKITMWSGLCSLLFLASAGAEVVTYPWPETAPESARYEVNIYQDCEQYQPRTLYSEPQLEQGPDGDGVTGLIEDRSLSYTPFSVTGEVLVEATKLYGSEAQRVEISPLSYGILPEYFDGRTVRFTLPDNLDPAYISVNFISADNKDAGNLNAVNVKHGLVIFADAPESNVPDLNQAGVVDFSIGTRQQIENADVIYFPAGDHDLRQKFGRIDNAVGTDARLFLQRNGQQIYFAPGAYVRGSIDANRYNNIRVTGRGVISGGDFYWHYFQDPNTSKGKTAYLDFTGSNDSEFEGFIIENPTHHTMPSGLNSTIRNIKIIGWASNHDGVRPGGGSLVEKVFIKTSDDLDYARDPHVFKDSVIWPMRNGAFGMLGWNNLGTGFTEYDNIRFIHSEWDIPADEKRNTGMIGSVLNQGIFLEQNTLENVYAEFGAGMIANISIEFEQQSDAAKNQPVNGSWGELKDFTFKNILMELPFQNSGRELVKNQLKGFEKDGAKATIHDFDFINIIAGDTVVTNANASDYFDIDPNTTYNINFTTEGNIYTVFSSANAGGILSPAGNLPTPEGMDRYINIVPDAGYRIADVQIDGQSVGAKQLVLLKNVQRDYNVTVHFEAGQSSDGEPLDCSVPDQNLKPSLTLTYPQVGTEFETGARVPIVVDGLDVDGYITQVEFLINGQSIGVDYARPYMAQLQSLASGGETVVAVATDDDGAQQSLSIVINTPSAPVEVININDLAVVQLGCDDAELTWSDVAGADKYRVRRRLTADSTYKNIGDVTPGVGYFHDTSNREDNASYVYMVRPMLDGKAVKISNTPTVINQCN